MKKVLLLGTGSIGDSSLEVIRANPQRLALVGVGTYSNQHKLSRIAKEFNPQHIAIANSTYPFSVNAQTTLFKGTECFMKIVEETEADTVIAALSGIAGLASTYRSLELGKTVLLANKESIVCGGGIFKKLLNRALDKIIPIDSEHMALYQLLDGRGFEEYNRQTPLSKLLITASGGPFLRFNGDLAKATKEDALAHPTWRMGSKISIDSSTMVNKALELFEACWLYNCHHSQVEVLVHPESLVHGGLIHQDASMKLSVSPTSMEIPIAQGLGIKQGGHNLDLTKHTFSFFEPDHQKFKALQLMRSLLESIDLNGGQATSLIAFNVANEVAVQLFLEGKINFIQIYQIIEMGLELCAYRMPPYLHQLDDVLALDKEVRTLLLQHIPS